jgi:CRP-like cAMP-binding protein
MALAANRSISNRILTALPQEDLEHLRYHLAPVSLRLKQVLHQPGVAITYVYFIEQGLASVLTAMSDGITIEVRMTGREGMTGLPYLLGAHSMREEIVVQVPGSALRMSAAQFKTEFDQREALRRIVLRFLNTALSMAAQTAGCNRRHPLDQRCARWLLNASDRIGSDTMPMTQEFLASLLGVRRAGITETVAKLCRSGLIRYRRGQLAIIDRKGLEAGACECYLVDREELGVLPSR